METFQLVQRLHRFQWFQLPQGIALGTIQFENIRHVTNLDNVRNQDVPPATTPMINVLVQAIPEISRAALF
jgi:hypothetical protein